MPRREIEPVSEDESDTDSDNSEGDYELPKKVLDSLARKSGISEERIKYLLNEQSGMCYMSSIPFDLSSSDSMYSIAIAPRRVNQPLGDTNSVMVCKVVESMRASSNLTWTQLKNLMSQCGRD